MPAVRDLLSVVLEDALRRFTQRAKKLEEGVLGGFGGRVARAVVDYGKAFSIQRRVGSLKTWFTVSQMK